MSDVVTTAFGGKTKQQKAMEKEQKRIAAEALATKIGAIQDNIGTRTRELVSRYGVAGMAGGKGL